MQYSQLPESLQAISNASAGHVSVISEKQEVHPQISQRQKFYFRKLNNKTVPHVV